MKENMIKRYLHIFDFCKDINIVVAFHKKTEDTIWKKWLYIATPIIIYFVNALFIIRAHVLWKNDSVKTLTLPYINDFSNSMGLSLLYFLSYFLSSYFPEKFEEWLKVGISRENLEAFRKKMCFRKNIEKCIALVLCVIISYGIGYGFYQNAKLNTGIWSHNLDIVATIYYTLFLAITWYHSLLLLGMVLSSGAVIYWSIKNNVIEYNKEDYNKNLSITRALDVLIVTFSYGLFYVVGSFIFILNDKVAAHPPINVVNTFANDLNSLILVVAVLLLAVLAYIPLHELLKFMYNKKKERLEDLNTIILTANVEEKWRLKKERDEVFIQRSVSTTFFNKIVLIFSVLIPLLGVIFQGIELLRK